MFICIFSMHFAYVLLCVTGWFWADPHNTLDERTYTVNRCGESTLSIVLLGVL